MKRHFRCVCCGSGYYSDKPQNPAFDDGHGAGSCCQERLAKSYERFGFAKYWSMSRNESAEMFERFA